MEAVWSKIMKTAIVIITMISGKLWFFIEALFLICLVRVLKGVIK
jgi:hypothetical protein